MPAIRRQGTTLIGLTLSNLLDVGAIQLALPFDRPLAQAIDTALDLVRDSTVRPPSSGVCCSVANGVCGCRCFPTDYRGGFHLFGRSRRLRA